MDPASTARRWRVGAMVLASGTLFVGLVLFILGSSLTTSLRSYSILFEENVKGMVVGSKVNFQGVPIGAVSDIRFRDGRTEVTVAVDPTKAELQTVTRARIDRLLVTGQVTIELEGHEQGGTVIHDGGVIHPIVSPMNQLMTSTLPDTLARADELLLRGIAVLTQVETLMGPENQRHLATMLEASATATTVLAEQLPRLLASADHRLADMGVLLADARLGLASMTQTSDRIGGLVAGDEVRQLLVATQQSITSLGRLERDFRSLADETRGLLAGSRQPLLETLTGARQALAELQSLARGLRLAPSSLLFGRQLEAAAPPPGAAPQGGFR